MSAPVATEDISALDFGLTCDWGKVVNSHLTHQCPEKPVWGIECPEVAKDWSRSCQGHYEASMSAERFDVDCFMCGKRHHVRELKWYKL